MRLGLESLLSLAITSTSRKFPRKAYNRQGKPSLIFTCLVDSFCWPYHNNMFFLFIPADL